MGRHDVTNEQRRSNPCLAEIKAAVTAPQSKRFAKFPVPLKDAEAFGLRWFQHRFSVRLAKAKWC